MNTAPPIHASCVMRFGRGVLIRGASGAGKSSLALQLMAQGWMLVADDYVCLRAAQGQLMAESPPQLRGLIEVCGVGIMPAPARLAARIDLIVDLAAGPPARLPLPEHETLLGCKVSVLNLPLRYEMSTLFVAEALRRTPVLG
jgi:HPr kinase/phosphorylase